MLRHLTKASYFNFPTLLPRVPHSTGIFGLLPCQSWAWDYQISPCYPRRKSLPGCTVTHPTALHPAVIPPSSPPAADPDTCVSARTGKIITSCFVLITTSRKTGQPELQMSLPILREPRCQGQHQASQNPQHSKLCPSDCVSWSIIPQEYYM